MSRYKGMQKNQLGSVEDGTIGVAGDSLRNVPTLRGNQ